MVRCEHLILAAPPSMKSFRTGCFASPTLDGFAVVRAPFAVPAGTAQVGSQTPSNKIFKGLI